jgi:hypothetical protein
MGSGGITPRILDLGTRWRWLVSFRPRPPYPQRKSPYYPLNRRLGGPQSRSGHSGKEKNSQPLPGLEPPIIQWYTTELSVYSFSFTSERKSHTSRLIQYVVYGRTETYPSYYNSSFPLYAPSTSPSVFRNSETLRLLHNAVGFLGWGISLYQDLHHYNIEEAEKTGDPMQDLNSRPQFKAQLHFWIHYLSFDVT